MALIIIFLGIAATIYYFYAMASIRKKLPNDYKGILSDSSSPTFAILLIIAVILSMGFLASEKWIERSHILPFVLTIAIMILVFRRIYLYQRFKKLNFPIIYLRAMFINTIVLILGLLMIVWGDYLTLIFKL
ncbi:hypothetical protein AQUSIP_24900 [Aquicella siphonis]|uniref:Uncharacterized protein n=1 Tax=Aquicella siphonis TaxID=254247 RepID=A0A5E4PLH3_9COXI|nr:hypothetical protein [Aquicella siphonis]VVC77163.1 hypothetical protein AQUSIP_24900 [Aquicella siphonis]